MFYLKEITFRFQYLSLSFLLCLSLCYYNRESLLFVLTFNVLASNIKLHQSGIDYFIYTHPSELLIMYLIVIVYFTSIIMLPQLLWICLDFLRSGLTKSEFIYVQNKINIGSTLLYISNAFCFLLLFPNFWSLFESFNKMSNSTGILNFFLELKIRDYVSFLKDFLYNTNICLAIIICLHFIINSYNLKNLLCWRRLFIFINFVFATLLSPPDIFSQVLNISVLTFFFELTLFNRVVESKSCKYIKLSIWHHVKSF